MDKIKDLEKYQKIILLVMAAMVLVYTMLYVITVQREGYAYKDGILIPKQENEATIYSGKVWGERAVFTVSLDKVVEFQYGDKTYGPYIVKEDATAIPIGEMSEDALGVEICCGEEVIFRGGAEGMTDYWWLLNEDGSPHDTMIDITMNDGTDLDEYGNPIKPSVTTILDLVYGPELTHKGDWFLWICGVGICILTASSILFADEIFRWNLSWQIRNADRAEPTEWELEMRKVAWVVYPIIAMIVFGVGLR